MKFKIIVLLLSLLYFSEIFAQPLNSLGTAYTVGKGRINMGVFSPLRMGITRSTEIQSFLFADYKIPNIGIKQYWITTFSNILVASKHSIYYPTPMIRNPLFASTFNLPDSFGLAPPTLAYRNELIFSKMLKEKSLCNSANYLLSVKFGIAAAFKLGADSLIPDYNQHLLYPRTSIFNDSVLWYVGVDLDGHISKSFDFFVDLEFQSIDWAVKDFAIEHKAGISYYLSRRVNLWLGYKAAIGSYPSPQLIFFSPMADITFSFTKPKFGRDKDLFKNKMF